MFGKVIVFGLFEMIKKKVRTASPGPGSASGSGTTTRAVIKGVMALKIDMSKAYDRIEWNYLKLIMLRLGFVPSWVDLMMHMIVVVNSNLVGPIVPKRGFRQGDPLSPYLFILCAQGLSSLLEDAEIRGLIHGAQICRGASKFSHLLFADDSVFFFRASEAECLVFNNILSLYEKASGQAMNFNKSRIFYNSDVHERKKLDLSISLGVSQALDTSSYLGLPTLIRTNKKYVFSYVQSGKTTKVARETSFKSQEGGFT